MKILTLNCSPDLSYEKSKGLDIICDSNQNLQKFPTKFLYKVKDSDGSMVDMYTLDLATYMEQTYGKSDYSIIYFAWKPSDYGIQMAHTGGFTCPQVLSNGAVWISVRNDMNFQNYFNHETMHALRILLNNRGIMVGDVMDSTPVGNKMMPYYENDYHITDPNSNFNSQWKLLTPYIDILNKITNMKVITITRKIFNNKETIGELRSFDGKFGCSTLELPWKNNQRNVSCIPTGMYVGKKIFSLKFGNVYQIQNVLNRAGIYFHEGNYFFNTDGCILLGSSPKDINGDGIIDISNSKLIRKAFEIYTNFEPFTLIIK